MAECIDSKLVAVGCVHLVEIDVLIYECAACRKMLEWRYQDSLPRFCPFCGIKFTEIEHANKRYGGDAE